MPPILRGGFAGLAEVGAGISIHSVLQTVGLPQGSASAFLIFNRRPPEPKQKASIGALEFPTPPEHATIAERIKLAEQMAILRRTPIVAVQAVAWIWFIQRVQTGGPWDFKKNGHFEYEPYGNWHFGVVAAAFGLTYNVAQSGAGLVQIKRALQGKTPWGEGIPFLLYPYGDRPEDASLIRRGWTAYHLGYRGT